MFPVVLLRVLVTKAVSPGMLARLWMMRWPIFRLPRVCYLGSSSRVVVVIICQSRVAWIPVLNSSVSWRNCVLWLLSCHSDVAVQLEVISVMKWVVFGAASHRWWHHHSAGLGHPPKTLMTCCLLISVSGVWTLVLALGRVPAVPLGYSPHLSLVRWSCHVRLLSPERRRRMTTSSSRWHSMWTLLA